MDLNAFEKKIRDGGTATPCEAINLAMYARELEVMVEKLRTVGDRAINYSNPENYHEWNRLIEGASS